MKRFLCALVSISLFAASLSGCGKKDDAETPSEAANGESVIYADLPEGVHAKVGDFEVGDAEFDFYLKNIISSVQQQVGDDAGWENETITNGMSAKEYIDKNLTDTLHSNYVFRMKAREMGIYSEVDEKRFIADEIIPSFGGEDEFSEFIASNGFDRSAADNYYAAMGAYYALAKNAYPAEDAEADFAKYISAKHILFTFENHGGEENGDEALKLANDAYNRAVAGESFEDLIEELNEDPGEDPATGYTFGEGEMVDEFYQAAKALEVGGISEPVKTTYGYHVIKRYPLPEKGSESYDTYVENIRLTNGSAAIENEIDSWLSEYPITVPENLLEGVDFSSYKSNVNTADGSVFYE